MNSILFTEDELKQGINIDQVHPLEYVHARNHQLKDIQQNIQVQRTFQTNNGMESVYLSSLFDQYKRKHADIQQKRMDQLKNLNPNHFDTILMDENDLKRTKKLKDGGTFSKTMQYSSQGTNNQDYKTSQFHQDGDEDSEMDEEEQQNLRNELYNAYVEGTDIDQNQVIGTVFERDISKGDQILYSVIEKKKEEQKDIQEVLTLKKEWLKELDEEIKQINKQNKTLQQKSQKSEICRNPKLISKLASSLFTQYHVYFDEIFNALMDDILEEEVEYFNEVENMEIQQLDEYERNKQSYKLKEVVRNQSLNSNLFGLIDQLDQYADEDEQYQYD